ncbi:glutathione S-transferase U8-like [Henckelia pumila]|uniref:glutathione S-transferase U8-like n=1 Tax=Henckelia pumila TaxID=405737 RepID=UPI003C6E7701
MAELQLFGTWGSPFSKRAEMGLKLKGIEYEFHEEDMKNKSPLLLKYNPVHKKVSVLVHDGKSIAESLVILEYIDDTWDVGSPILPKTPYERVKARFWAKFIDENVLLIKYMFQTQLVIIIIIIILIRSVHTYTSKSLLERRGGGDTVGLVDIAASFIAYWFGIIAECGEVEKFKALFRAAKQAPIA